MSKPKLTYFDAPASRGEECRIALHLAGVDFEDDRVKQAAWPSVKATTPFGKVPVFTLPGQPPLAEVNAILALIGRRYGLHPKDDFEAARHEMMMSHAEELRATLGQTLRIKDATEKQKAREAIVADYIPGWCAGTEKQIGDGPFFGGAAVQVVDVKLYILMRWILNGTLDHVPPAVFDGYAKMNRLYAAVRDHAGVKSWVSKQ